MAIIFSSLRHLHSLFSLVLAWSLIAANPLLAQEVGEAEKDDERSPRPDEKSGHEVRGLARPSRFLVDGDNKVYAKYPNGRLGRVNPLYILKDKEKNQAGAIKAIFYADEGVKLLTAEEAKTLKLRPLSKKTPVRYYVPPRKRELAMGRKRFRKKKAYEKLLPPNKVPFGTAVLLSGGGTPFKNNERYYFNLDKGHHVFADWQKHNLVANGLVDQGPNYVLNDPSGSPLRDSDGFIRMGTKTADQIPGGISGKASWQDLQQLFEDKIKNEDPSQPLVLYITDHGNRGDGPQGRKVFLWDDELLTVPQLRSLLQKLPAERQVILMNDQCYGGGMLEALWSEKGELRPHACGLAAATRDQVARSGGGVMETLEAAKKQKRKSYSLFSAYRDMQGRSRGRLFNFAKEENDPLVRNIVRSTPIATSDLFLSRYLQEKKGPRDLINALSCQNPQLSFFSLDSVRDMLLPEQRLVLTSFLQDMDMDLTMAAIHCKRESHLKFDPFNFQFGDIKDKIENELNRVNQGLSDDFYQTKDEFSKVVKEYLPTLPGFKEMEALKKELDEGQLKLREKDDPQLRKDLQEMRKKYQEQYTFFGQVKDALLKWDDEDVRKMKMSLCQEVESFRREFLGECGVSFQPAGVNEELKKELGPLRYRYRREFVLYLLEYNQEQLEKKKSAQVEDKKKKQGKKGKAGPVAPAPHKEMSEVEKAMAEVRIEQKALNDQGLLERLARKEKSFRDFERSIRTCQNFLHILNRFIGVQSMIESKDVKAIDQYLNLLRCERTELPLLTNQKRGPFGVGKKKADTRDGQRR